MLEGKTAVIYGGSGAIGGAVARAFAEAGARVHVAGRRPGADVTQLDVLDERAVLAHLEAVGPIDIAVNAVSFPYAQGTLAELTVEEVMQPLDGFLRSNLITAQAAARHMTARGSGTILTLSTAGAAVRAAGEPRLRHELRGAGAARASGWRPSSGRAGSASSACARTPSRMRPPPAPTPARCSRRWPPGRGRERRGAARAVGRRPDAAGAAADAGAGGRRGGVRWPRIARARSRAPVVDVSCRQRDPGAAVRRGAGRRARLTAARG